MSSDRTIKMCYVVCSFILGLLLLTVPLLTNPQNRLYSFLIHDTITSAELAYLFIIHVFSKDFISLPTMDPSLH